MRQFLHAAALLLLVVRAGTAYPGEESAPPARFHHVLLNSTDPDKSLRFYRRVFGAVPIKFRNASDALLTERSYILFNKVDTPPDATLNTGVWHIGWGGVDVKNEYEWWKNHDVPIHTPLSPLPGRDNFYFYISGPDKELIEINTMGHHRFGHVHFFCDDVNETVGWYQTHLGLTPRAPRVAKPQGDPNTLAGIWMNVIQCDNVSLIYFGKPDRDPAPTWWPDPPLKELHSTRNHPIERIGFSYEKIEPVYQRMQAAGVTIVEPITERPQYKLKSFVVEGPDKVLIEIAQAKPIPEGVWE